MTHLVNKFFGNLKINYVQFLEAEKEIEKAIIRYKEKYPDCVILISFLTSPQTLETHIVKFILGKPDLKNIFNIFYSNSFNKCEGYIKIIVGSKKQTIYCIKVFL